MPSSGSRTSYSRSLPKNPDVLTVLLIAIILLALLFDYTNGFHDAANAIASAISTRALTPRTALIIAAIANLGGALLSTGVAVTVAKSIIDPPSGPEGMAVVLAALAGAIAWNFITWAALVVFAGLDRRPGRRRTCIWEHCSLEHWGA